MRGGEAGAGVAPSVVSIGRSGGPYEKKHYEKGEKTSEGHLRLLKRRNRTIRRSEVVNVSSSVCERRKGAHQAPTETNAARTTVKSARSRAKAKRHRIPASPESRETDRPSVALRTSRTLKRRLRNRGLISVTMPNGVAPQHGFAINSRRYEQPFCTNPLCILHRFVLSFRARGRVSAVCDCGQGGSRGGSEFSRG